MEYEGLYISSYIIIGLVICQVFIGLKQADDEGIMFVSVILWPIALIIFLVRGIVKLFNFLMNG
jgi:hypothetical protein